MSAGGVADPAALAVPLQYRFPQTAEVLPVLLPEHVANSAEAPPLAAICRTGNRSSAARVFHRRPVLPLRNSISLPRTIPLSTVSTKPSSISRASGAAKPLDFVLL